MTPIEKAQMHLLLRRWHDYADELYFDERSACGWLLLDQMDKYVAPESLYRPCGARWWGDA